jgi:hypothetical protein
MAMAQHGTDSERCACRPGTGAAAWRRCVEPGYPRRKSAAWANDSGENRLRCQRQPRRGCRSEKIVLARSHPSITIAQVATPVAAALVAFGGGIFPTML